MKAQKFIKRIKDSNLEEYDIMIDMDSIVSYAEKTKDFDCYNENEELDILRVEDNAIILGIE